MRQRWGIGGYVRRVVCPRAASPKAMHGRPEWHAAREALILVAEEGANDACARWPAGILDLANL